MRLTVLMPCHQGGDMFKEAIISLIKSGLRYDGLVVSFNGDQKDLECWVKNVFSKKKDIKLEVLTRAVAVEAKKHISEISQYLMKHYEDDDMFIFLAHDDKLKKCDEFDIEQYSVLSGYMPTIFPTYVFQHDYKNPEGVVLSKFNWFVDSIKGRIDTNISGMIVSNIALSTVVKGFSEKITWSRFENMLALNKNVGNIVYSKALNVEICAREDSEGAIIKKEDSRHDEIKYCDYVRKNLKINPIQVLVFHFYRLKKVLAYLVGPCLK